MFVHSERLQHVLDARHYHDPTLATLEDERIFARDWQFACSHSEVSRPGEFVTFWIGSTPVIVRNFDGAVRAFVNVCPHRHSMLTGEEHGRCDVLRCQYHGWEFKADGRTGRIPEPKAFRPWDREHSHLRRLRLERCGDLWFVNPDPDAEDLEHVMGPMFEIVDAELRTPDWFLGDRWDFDNDCNWKVPSENTLESYHIQAVHPTWFDGGLPAEGHSDHVLGGSYSMLTFNDDVPLIRDAARARRWMGGTPKRLYRHLFLNPNTTVMLSDSFAYVSSCVPTSPTTCRIRTRVYGYRGPRLGRGPAAVRAAVVRRIAFRVGRRQMKRIFAEDRTIYVEQQRGLCASHQPGVIGTREERVWALQRYVADRIGEGRRTKSEGREASPR